jgi:hypothetical protein
LELLGITKGENKMGAVTKLIKMALKDSSEKLSKKYTGKTLTNILKSISKNKTGLEEQGIKVGPLKKKVASAKNKRKSYVVDQDAENRYGTIAQGATKDGKEVPLTERKKGGILKRGLKALPRTLGDVKTEDRRMAPTGKTRKPKMVKPARPVAKSRLVGPLKKKKAGGMIGDGNKFVASFYKGYK